jgi:hypothetical protein
MIRVDMDCYLIIKFNGKIKQDDGNYWGPYKYKQEANVPI